MEVSRRSSQPRHTLPRDLGIRFASCLMNSFAPTRLGMTESPSLESRRSPHFESGNSLASNMKR
eukprot:4018362-Prymnesium_polylepis.1